MHLLSVLCFDWLFYVIFHIRLISNSWVSFIFNIVYVYILLVLLKRSVQLLTLCS
jgi:hypothetical protein